MSFLSEKDFPGVSSDLDGASEGLDFSFTNPFDIAAGLFDRGMQNVVPPVNLSFNTNAQPSAQPEQPRIDTSHIQTFKETVKLDPNRAAADPGAVRDEAIGKRGYAQAEAGKIQAQLQEAGANAGAPSSEAGGGNPLTPQGIAADFTAGTAITGALSTVSPELASIAAVAMTFQTGVQAFEAMGRGTMATGGNDNSSTMDANDSSMSGFSTRSAPQPGTDGYYVQQNMTRGMGGPSADDMNFGMYHASESLSATKGVNLYEGNGVPQALAGLRSTVVDANRSLTQYQTRVDSGVLDYTGEASQRGGVPSSAQNLENQAMQMAGIRPEKPVMVSGAVA